MKAVKRLLGSSISWAKNSSHTHLLVVFLVLIAGLTATIIFRYNTRSQVNSDIATKYQRQASLIESLITLRLQQDLNILNGGAGLLTINPDITQTAWAAFYQSYNLRQNYVGIDAASFSKYIAAGDLSTYLGTMTQTKPNFTISPSGTRSEYAPVTFVAAISPVSMNSIGYDPLADSVRGMAMRTARDLGTPVMSGKISLVAAHKGQPAFIIYKAVYSQTATTLAERRASLYGYVFSAVNVADMFNDLSGEMQNPSYAFQIFDGLHPFPQALMYQTANFPALNKQSIKTSMLTLTVDSHTWNIKLVAAPNIIPTSERQLPMVELIRGTVITVGLSGLLWYIITNRERKLIRLRQQAVQATKDDLLTLASHQLRTPATIVKQHIGILLQNYAGKITKPQREILDTAYAGNERQLEIINQFLEVARFDAGRLKLHKKPVDISTLVEKVMRLEQAIATKKGQTILYKSPKPVRVIADPHYLQMALENVVSNASKYTPKQSIITVKVRKYKKELLITISDNGIGMTKKEVVIIFDKFTRIENELTADANGSGIGLYLTKQIILLHGGDIEVESTPGKGSTFTIRLPLEE